MEHLCRFAAVFFSLRVISVFGTMMHNEVIDIL